MHDARSYYGLNQPSKKEKEKLAASDSAPQDPHSLGYTKFNKGRMEELAKPVNKERHKLVHDLQEQVDERAGKKVQFGKEAKIAERLKHKKTIAFEDYVDRDVAPIRADTGEFSTSIKTSVGLKQLDTKVDKKNGVFEMLARDHSVDSYAVQNKKEQITQ